MMVPDKNQHAQKLFDGIATQYDLLAEVFSFFQYRRWRNHLVSLLEVEPEDTVMDLCTGTGGVAAKIVRTYSCRVLGVDLSREMLGRSVHKFGEAGLAHKMYPVMGCAECLPFTDERFDGVCFTYLMRYVDSPCATFDEIVRVLKPGGRLVSLEFGVPQRAHLRWAWYAYTRGVLPLVSAGVSKGWREVGSFLGPSISRFYRSHSVGQLEDMWKNGGVTDVQVKRMSFGGAVLMWGTKSG